MPLGSACRLRARCVLEGGGGNTHGCRRHVHSNAVFAYGVSRGVLPFPTSKAAGSAPSQSTISQKWFSDLVAQVHDRLCRNQWQAAMRLISSLPLTSQDEAVEATPSCTLRCEPLIAALLCQGHGESAFTIWRTASTHFNFALSPRTMMRFAVYTLLVDCKPQEALDFVAMAALPVEDEVVAAGPWLEHFALWTTFIATLSSDGMKSLQERTGQPEAEVNAAFAGLLRLSLQPVGEGETRLGVERLQLALHALVSLILCNGGGEALQTLCSVSFVKSNDSSIGTLLRVAKLLSMKPVDYETSSVFLDDVPFMITRVLSLPLVCASKESAPLLSGLEVYRSFFIDSDAPRSSENEKVYFSLNTTTAIAATNTVVHTTVGDVLLRRILRRGVEQSLFLYSVVLHDIDTSSTSLMTQLLALFLSRDLCDMLCDSFGKHFISVVRRAVKEVSLRGALPMPLLGYVSRAIGPFLNTDLRHHEAELHIAVNGREGGCHIGRNMIFYLALLASLIVEVPDAQVRAWRRFVARVTRTIINDMDSGGRAAISQDLRLQLHLRWWLPELLMLVDSTRECLLCEALQRAFPPTSLTEWDQGMSAMLRTLHKKEHSNRGSSTPCWAFVGHVTGQNELGIGETAASLHSDGRLLVRRLVRWEWLLKGLWEFARNTSHDGCQGAWKCLLDVCAETLNHCRVYHRHDIARELINIMLLPAVSLLPPSAEPPTKGNCCDTSLIGLLINGPKDFCATSSTLMEPRWRLVGEVYRWMPTLQGWDRMRKLQALLPPSPHDAAQRFLLLEHLINDLLRGEGKGAVPGTGERVRVGKVFEWYEELCRGDLTLRTPQLLLPLARALCGVSLLDLLSELVRNTFCDLWRGFQAPQPPFASRLLLEALCFYSAHHGLAKTRMRLGGDAEVLAELSPAAYDGARGMVTAFAETYIIALWQHDCFPALASILLKPEPPNAGSTALPSLSVACPKAISQGRYFASAEIAYLLPEAEREALRLFLLLTFAQRCDSPLYESILRRLPRRKADPARVAVFVDRIVAQEPSLFTSLSTAAQRVARGTWRLREACASIAASHAKGEAKAQAVDCSCRSRERSEVRTVRDLNRCIDNCDWVTALRAIPHILSDPLHTARKALLACEKAPKGTVWQGAMSVFANSRHTWKQQSPKISPEQQKEAESSRFHASIGIQECGRIMTLLADAKRWREAPQLFELLGPYGMDGFTFSQACFALRAGGHPELAIDLWATWRAYVGDAVEPTAQMCGHFLRCGVVGNTTVADAACVLLKMAVNAHARQTMTRNAAGLSSPNRECTPGTTLPLSVEKEENTITALLRDRWHESWQEALQVALVSERPRIIHAVTRESPSNYHVYEAVMRQVTRERRRLSLEERCAIAKHLDLKNVLSARGNSVGTGDDRAVCVLQQLLGDEEED
ncbi:hypothetical protein TRSC58_06504 [Trypanosoma rangeli SC58]|uniref:Uncharacterized protein n=1 Tax=Trypanosoma rangeli SC58 TaxID=429131 RepID=A0A061IXR9_TRYRA|nr:hypothetical protein TRSC58_06504 [Trypanosoma rangeli SC58]